MVEIVVAHVVGGVVHDGLVLGAVLGRVTRPAVPAFAAVGTARGHVDLPGVVGHLPGHRQALECCWITRITSLV